MYGSSVTKLNHYTDRTFCVCVGRLDSWSVPLSTPPPFSKQDSTMVITVQVNKEYTTVLLLFSTANISLLH